MINGKRLLALIPARGGSKRLPRKNVLDLSGKPLIAWTIEAARNSKYVDNVVVSTDDEQISTISRDYGAIVPFKRPTELSSDDAKSIDVVLHTIQTLHAQEDDYDYLILLQPTSPLRQAIDIDLSVEQLIRDGLDAVISVCENEHHPFWSNTLPADRDMSNFLNPSIRNKRSQDLPTYYRVNGAIYLCNINKIIDEKDLFLKNKCHAYIMDNINSVDIDTEIDFLLASQIIDLLISRNNSLPS